MKKLNNKELKKIQAIELDILKSFDKICKKNKLKYVLTGGTLIGAIRHNGFIPWDDDIDIAMPRNDYNKFIKIQKKELNKEKYYFQSIETEEKYSSVGAKIRRKNSVYKETLSSISRENQGIWIDIFPIDNISDNKISAFFTFTKMFYYKMLLSYKLKNNPTTDSLPKKILLSIIKLNSNFYSLKKLKKKYFKLITKTNKKETKNVINFGGVYLLKEKVPREFINNITTHQFEDEKFNIPKNYDEYLTHIYGDYMQLPPKEKRKSNHFIEELKFPNNNK